jgi:metal-responsive CopG/Arc/MetJ family transcriptional regulator
MVVWHMLLQYLWVTGSKSSDKATLLNELDNLGNEKFYPCRGDIFKRIIKNGIVFPNNVNTFNLIFGISRTVGK